MSARARERRTAPAPRFGAGVPPRAADLGARSSHAHARARDARAAASDGPRRQGAVWGRYSPQPETRPESPLARLCFRIVATSICRSTERDPCRRGDMDAERTSAERTSVRYDGASDVCLDAWRAQSSSHACSSSVFACSSCSAERSWLCRREILVTRSSKRLLLLDCSAEPSTRARASTCMLAMDSKVLSRISEANVETS
mmetsp:Transcript_62590/g.173191  ORF Transcript_62590/g.173191 Transcript_62590/m.173191 type:complete len:201 (-) Transcript_62590:545-1147(-)